MLESICCHKNIEYREVVKMKLFGWSTGSKIEEFAKNIAQDIAEKYPPDVERDEQKKVSAKRISKVLEESYKKAIFFKNKNKLGIYKKSKLSNTFRWELDKLGYSKKFIDVATEGLVVYMTRKSD